MKTAGVRELKARLSAYLRDVQRGETILVTDRGRVVAEVRPPGADARVLSRRELRYQDLVDRGVLRLATSPDDRSWARSSGAGAPPGTAQSVLDAERGE
jgi:antitoxin (DNA-binding transcriptional repressor) of toxin-antitoxin stability system